MTSTQQVTEPEAQVAAAIDEVPAQAPRVGIVMAVQADMDVMEGAAAVLRDRGIVHEVRVLGTAEQPTELPDYCANARMRGLRVLIVAARLGPEAAGHTDLPVVGVPLSTDGGVDAVLADVRPGLPVACVGTDRAGDAGHVAARILSL